MSSLTTPTSNGDDSDDAPEEFTSLQGLLHSQEIAKAQQHSLSRARGDLKDRRKKRAQRLTPKTKTKPPPADDEMVDDDPLDSTHQSHLNSGMLSNHIISLLAARARQNQVFLSDSDQDTTDIKPKRKKKKANLSGIETVILKDLLPSHCVQSSLEFLNKRKMQAPRSSAVLNNSNQALRLLSSSGLLK